MYHSITFGSKNSYTHWHLVPDSRPVVVMPEQKKQQVDIPGGNGVVDLSMSLYRFPVYNRRSGSFTFHVLNNYSGYNWAELYQEIVNYLHGPKRTMRLEDDPNYEYKGYFGVQWTSNNDGSGSEIEISYDLEPYKKARTTTWFEMSGADSNSFVQLGPSSSSRSLTKNISQYNGVKSTLPTPLIIEITDLSSNSQVNCSFVNRYLGTSYNNMIFVEDGVYSLSQCPVSRSTSSSHNLTISAELTATSGSSPSCKIRAGYAEAKL